MPVPAAPEPTGTAVVWFRRDLRLADHPALVEACRTHRRVVPLFVWDPALLRRAGASRVSFLVGCVDRLRVALGGRLVTRYGHPGAEVAAVARACGAATVFVSADYGPYGAARDRQVQARLAADGRRLVEIGSPYAVDPGELLTATGRPFSVFGAFARAWRARPPQAVGPRPSLSRISSCGLPSCSDVAVPSRSGGHVEPGEDAGLRRLDRFREVGLSRYRDARDLPALDVTSRLSPYLRFGCLHPRQLLAGLDLASPSHLRFATEVCWRDFLADVLHHRPASARVPIRPDWAGMAVDEGPLAEQRFDAWRSGRTGYPLVDAGMRQLHAQGWMHNRARLVTASFLVKDLHLDWTRGAGAFMEQLVDGDLASNQLNWQWVAGCGVDAAPYFRVLNPVTQAKRFDPDGRYVRRWVPELRRVPDGLVHEPWLAGRSGYPPPVVDHARERREALSRYGAVRSDGQRGLSR